MYKEVEALLENTIFEANCDETEKILFYRIRPKEGYKLHVKELDESTLDECGNETKGIKQGYTMIFITADVNYDFEKNPREIYAVRCE